MNDRRNLVTTVFAAILIVLGILFLIGQFVNINLGAALWPFWIIGVGVVFLVLMYIGGSSSSGLAIPGSIITMIGLILLYHNTFGHWEGWAYEWSLIPMAVGIGLVLMSFRDNHEERREAGRRLIRLGAILFLAFGIFFELIIGFSRTSGTVQIFWPVAIILVGVYLLISRLRPGTFDLFKPKGSSGPSVPPEAKASEPENDKMEETKPTGQS